MPRRAAVAQHWKAFASRRRDPASKREAVLKTAAQLFLEKSYGRTTLDDVAERLNITKPALYHYFHNKEDILLGCYRWGTALIEASLNEIAGHCGTSLEKVAAFIYSYANVMTVNFGRCVMRLDEGDLSSKGLAEVRAYKRKIDRRLRLFIQEGMDDGSIAPCDPKIAAFAIAGALNWICMWYEPEGALSPEEIASQFAETLTGGLAAKKRDRSQGASALKLDSSSQGDPRRGGGQKRGRTLQHIRAKEKKHGNDGSNDDTETGHTGHGRHFPDRGTRPAGRVYAGGFI